MNILDIRACSLGIAIALVAVVPAFAADYSAKRSGDWSNPSTWKPRGVPGAGDRVVALGRHEISISASVEVGQPLNPAAKPDIDKKLQEALVIDGSGALVLKPGGRLAMHGHLVMRGDGARLEIGADARLSFAAPQDAALQLQMFGRNQRLVFAGESEKRGEIGLAENADGHWFVASQGHRDSLIAGAYGRISDALDPESGKAWSMYLANDRTHSRLVARKIEFVNSGQVGIFGLDAAEFTAVDISGWTFRRSHPAAEGLPSLWFDGYGDVVATPAMGKAVKRIRDLSSDKEVYVRYVQGYELDNWVLGANGKPGSVRAGNNGGNARVQRDLFQVVRDSGGVGLVADTTENAYLYAEADNPHGFETRHLRGDALLRNFWFESHFESQSDTGDAILTNGPQSWVAEHGGTPVTLSVEHSGSIGDTSDLPRHPVFLTLNNSEGMRFRLRHNVMRLPRKFNAVALDENGETPSGTGLEFTNNLVFSERPAEGYALGSAAGKSVAQVDAFQRVDQNLYFNLKPRSGGYPEGVHAMRSSVALDKTSWFADPKLRDTSRNLAQWDLLLGGPGTAESAIGELLKLNDDVGFNPAYRIGGLIAFVRGGFVPTNPDLLDEERVPLVGPALAPVP